MSLLVGRTTKQSNAAKIHNKPPQHKSKSTIGFTIQGNFFGGDPTVELCAAAAAALDSSFGAAAVPRREYTRNFILGVAACDIESFHALVLQYQRSRCRHARG